MIEVERIVDNNILTVVTRGSIDTMTAPELEEKLQDVNNFEGIIFDFKDLDYLSSAGLRLLLMSKKENDNVIVKNVPEVIYEVLEITGFTEILAIE